MRLLWLIGAALVIAFWGCASAPGPELEGGIVGTGNRPDCEALKKKGETLPAECIRVSEPRPYR
jgi:hypothetical protein